MTVDPRAQAGFTAGVESYEQTRPSYPPAAIEKLVQVAGIHPGTKVLDLAAGTGKLTRLLAGLADVEIVAVEPVEAMREALTVRCPSVAAMNGTAEAIPQPSGSVDVVTVAQAFHWFDAAVALGEIHRVLRPGGTVVLLWNTRDRRVPWVAEWDALLAENTPSQPFAAYHEVDWPGIVAATGGFEPLRVWRTSWSDVMDVERLVGRAASVSTVATLPDDARERLLNEVRALARTHPALAGQQEFGFPYVTSVWWARAE